MRAFASGIGLIPEQDWEFPDLAASPYGTDPTLASIGFTNGGAAGSASPLTWSAASFVRLTADLAAGRNVVLPAVTSSRYVAHTQGTTTLTVTSPADGSVMAGSPVMVTGTTATGAVLLNVLLAKMVADWFGDRDLATAMGILVVSWPVGIGLALVVLGPLSVTTSWTFALQTSTGVCIAAFLLVALLYRDPVTSSTKAGKAQPASRLTRQELTFASLSGAVWTFYNVAYIIVVSFAPLLLADRGLAAADAALVASAATWPVVVSVPLGGVLADRTGRGEVIMHACFLAMAVSMPFMLMAPSPLIMLTIFGLVMGPAAGIIMALPARVLRPEARSLGMGVYYTWYYVGMAVLPGLAGWCRDLSGVAAAPLMFASLLVIIAIACAASFRRLERRSINLAA